MPGRAQAATLLWKRSSAAHGLGAVLGRRPAVWGVVARSVAKMQTVPSGVAASWGQACWVSTVRGLSPCADGQGLGAVSWSLGHSDFARRLEGQVGGNSPALPLRVKGDRSKGPVGGACWSRPPSPTESSPGRDGSLHVLWRVSSGSWTRRPVALTCASGPKHPFQSRAVSPGGFSSARASASTALDWGHRAPKTQS